MSISVKEAYSIACNAVNGLKIYACRELSDCWLFGCCMENGSAIHIPPIKVLKKTGDISLYDESGVAFLNGNCREEGVPIPIDNIISDTPE